MIPVGSGAMKRDIFAKRVIQIIACGFELTWVSESEIWQQGTEHTAIETRGLHAVLFG